MFRPSVAARLAAVLVVGAGPLAAQAPAARVTSPDGRIVVRVTLDSLGVLRYALDRDGRALLLPSRLGFAFRGAPPLDRGLALVDTARTAVDTTWTQPWGEVARVRTTVAKQLALYVVIYSPVQMAADVRENYANQPAFAFIRDVPVDWDTTRVLAGAIGDYVVVARKAKGAPDWYVGAITDEQARTLDVPLDFLPRGQRYVAEAYADGPGAHWLTNPEPVAITTRAVTSATRLRIVLAPGGGQAIRIRPARR